MPDPRRPKPPWDTGLRPSPGLALTTIILALGGCSTWGVGGDEGSRVPLFSTSGHPHPLPPDTKVEFCQDLSGGSHSCDLPLGKQGCQRPVP